MRSIRQIDQAIDANRIRLQRRRTLRMITADDWQAAWDANPDLYAAERELFSERWEVMQVRDRIAERDAKRAERANNAKQRKAWEQKRAAEEAMERAAPAMLAALQMFLAWDDDTHDTSPTAQHERAMKMARAAVAKVAPSKKIKLPVLRRASSGPYRPMPCDGFTPQICSASRGTRGRKPRTSISEANAPLNAETE